MVRRDVGFSSDQITHRDKARGRNSRDAHARDDWTKAPANGRKEKFVADSQAQKAFPVSWDQFHRDARALAWRLSGAGPF
jgi:hypothetical protein